MKNKHKDISIISPVFNEEDNLWNLYEAIKKNIPSKYSWELIFIDDGSTDNSRHIIADICKNDTHIKAIFLSKNFGHQVALTAGYDEAFGRVVISMDSDLQHPPEIIVNLIEKWEEGYDIVLARRISSEKLGWLKKGSSKLFYRMMKVFSCANIIQDVADFRLLDQRVVQYLRKFRESTRFIRGIVSDIGFNYAIVDYHEMGRNFGESKYNFRRMFRLGLNGVTAFSTGLLHVSTIIGAVISLLSIAYAIWIFCYKLLYGFQPGVASLMVGVFFIGGIQLIAIGVLGVYIANIFNEVKQRPLYCVDRKLSESNEENISNRG